MKILWACPTLMHPTINGSQIRTLGILRHLSRRHDIHFVGLSRTGQSHAERAEYCSQVYSFVQDPPKRKSPKFAWQALGNFFSEIPLYVDRYRSTAALEQVKKLMAVNRYDVIVADFLLSAPNVPSIEDAVLFQHNVETLIMTRLAEQAPFGPARAYMKYMAGKLDRYEGSVCRRARHVITVSQADSKYIESHHRVPKTSALSTGVNVEHLRRPEHPPQQTPYDLVFVGSLDYLPNLGGVRWFAEQVLPLILRDRPETTVALVGKNPDDSVRKLEENNRRIHVTGTVPDVRPYLWNSKVSIVPLFAGSGTRLKIYEAMAAGVPVVSTSIGAEGLTYENGRTIVIADEAQAFAAECLALLADDGRRNSISVAACRQVTDHFDWSNVALEFEGILQRVVAK